MSSVTAATKKNVLPAQINKAIREISADDPVIVTVQGTCMEPRILHGTRLQVVPAKWYWPGDIVVYCPRNNNYLIHRVIGAYRRHGTWKILTQADHALSLIHI